MPEQNKTQPSTCRVTLVDVAREAGVSRATASLVLRNSPLVADETRERVLAAMQSLGYVYNRGAARLRTRQSHTIGLVVPDISNPFYAELTVAIENQLDQGGYVALLANTSDTAGKQARFLESVLEHGVDGVLISPAKETSPEVIENLNRMIPVVQFVRRVPGLAVDYVGSENVNGTRAAVEHLIDHGHRRIAFLGGAFHSSSLKERREGYTLALEGHGLPVDETLMISGSISRNAGYQALLQVMKNPDPPTAAMCYNDVVAFGVMLGLQDTGRIPGKDFAVVGFDNIADAASWRPALTTVSGDPHTIGEAAVTRLLSRIAHRDAEVESILMPSQLLVRESCGAHAQSLSSASDHMMAHR
ncbi:MAG: LacI family DNA-binding transcriptional regulator [Anaerolineae bacterium]|nr:LacI family DNA-binding transcriptional regulator [Anaerolineae bacterium]